MTMDVGAAVGAVLAPLLTSGNAAMSSGAGHVMYSNTIFLDCSCIFIDWYIVK